MHAFSLSNTVHTAAYVNVTPIAMTLTKNNTAAPQVVFGTPLSHEPGEDVAVFHDRYVAALVALGKQHGVELSVV
jgi:hypothetical protein